MNAPHSPSLLAGVPMAPSDPILGVTEAFVAEPNPRKVNLGVGVYYDDQGRIPLLECVRHAESERLKSGTDSLRRVAPDSEVWISEPSWENHRQIFEAAGFTVKSYPYYDPATKGLDFEGMKRALSALPAGAIVVLHACCHNPTGVD